MGVLDTLKEAVGLIQKVDNIDLYKQMLELQTQVIALFEENRTLKDRLATRDQLTFKKNAYWMGDEGPFCSRCWDAESKLVRLHVQAQTTPRCPSCTRLAVNPDVPPVSPLRRSARSSWLSRTSDRF